MDNTLSHRIVKFIGGLHPVYAHEIDGKTEVARSLSHGHLYVPLCQPDIEDEANQQLVEVWWAGNKETKSSVNGDMLASVALIEYANFQVNSGLCENAGYIIERLSAHYVVKTGSDMVLSPHYLTDESLEALRMWKGGFTAFATNVFAGVIAGKLI